MTQLRAVPDDISNFFDRLMRGIGHRGSSFADIDRLCFTHDGGKETNRFLFQEFKRIGEPLISDGQRWALEALAQLPNVTVWGARHVSDGRVALLNFATKRIEVISAAEYQHRVFAWWDGK